MKKSKETVLGGYGYGPGRRRPGGDSPSPTGKAPGASIREIPEPGILVPSSLGAKRTLPKYAQDLGPEIGSYITDGSISPDAIAGGINQGIVGTVAFTATARDALSWSAGSIIAGGTTYSIDAGSLSGMSDDNWRYVYLDTAVSETVLQTTTTPANAVGSGKHLVATTRRGSAADQLALIMPINTDPTYDESVFADDAVTARIIAAGVITADHIAALTITAEKIAAGAVTTAKIAAGAVEAAKIDALAVTADKIDALAVTAAKIAAGAVTTAKLDALAVTAEKIAAATITADKLNVTSLSAISANIGTVNAGLINNQATDPTRGIRLNSGVGKPGTWTGYLDLAASGADPVLKLPGLEITAAGAATYSGDLSAAGGTFSGTVASSSFTALVASFSGRIVVGVGGGNTEFHDYVRFRTGGEIGIEDGRIMAFYDPDNVFRGDLRARADGDIMARGNWYFGGAVNDSIHMTGDLEIDGALNHDGSTLGLFGAPPVTKPGAVLLEELATISGSGADTDINANFSALYNTLSELQNALDSLGAVSVTGS